MLVEREQTGDLLPASRPKFAPATTLEQNGRKMEFRRVRILLYPQVQQLPAPLTTATLFTQTCQLPVTHHTLLSAHLQLQIPVPQHRLTPLRNSWMALYTPITEHMQLDMRMNLKSKKVCRATAGNSTHSFQLSSSMN